MTIIPDHATAKRIGFRAVEQGKAIGYRVFQYEQPRSGLTLYGALLVQAGGAEQEVRHQ